MTQLTAAELGRLAGPLLVGYILDWGLFGVLSMQVYVYYLALQIDRAGYKALVYGSYLLEATQTFLFTNSAFRTFATGFGNLAVLDQVDILWFSIPIMSGMVAFVAQSFYAYRITVLSKSKYFAAVIMLLSFIQLGGAIAIGIETKKSVLFSRFVKTKTFPIAAIWEGGSALCNVVIAACMSYYLRRQDPGLKQTSVSLTRIIRLTIETGTLTAAIAILTIILTFLPGRPSYYQASVSVLGKAYLNSMMVAFNSRMKIGSTSSSNTAHHVSIPMTHPTGTRLEVEIAMNSDTQVGAGATREEVSVPDSGDTRYISQEKEMKRSSQDLGTIPLH